VPMSFLTQEWAADVRRSINAGPDAGLRARKADNYWDWVDRVRTRYRWSWALGGQPTAEGPQFYLLLCWSGGSCSSATVVGADEAERADFLLTASHQVWRALFDGLDPGRAVMDRAIRLRRGSVLEFFRGLYLFTETIASICRVPTVFPDVHTPNSTLGAAGSTGSGGFVESGGLR